jgi:hypothetical protein
MGRPRVVVSLDEPRAPLPFAHWLPPALRRPYWRLGAGGGRGQIGLLRGGELDALFAPAATHAERFGPLVKSWVCVHACGPSPPQTGCLPGNSGPRSGGPTTAGALA